MQISIETHLELQARAWPGLLQTRFGLKEFRKGQLEIIQAVMQGQDVLAVLPTGGGKSLCFQLPAVLKNSLVVVISPLIALMKDQVASLKKRGISAGALHSGQSDDDKRIVFTEMSQGGAFLLYISPERAQKDGFHHWIKKQNVALFAIDEAHCVSQWGHDFREEYGQLSVLKKLRPDVPVLALTASATPLVLNDIAKNLGLVKPSKHVHGFYRPNLYYQVETCEDEDEKFLFLQQALMQNLTGRIIVYCGTRKLTEKVAEQLQAQFCGVSCYHAGLSSQERNKIQEAYANSETRILVATNAFGMGIDHPDVRLVIHYNMPANIDALYQEMGRAGRDGLPSTCLMLFSSKDKGLQSFFIQSSEASPQIKSSRWNTLNAIVAYAEGGECRHSEILTYYKDSQRLKKCGHCDICDPRSDRKIQKGKAAPAIASVRLRKAPTSKSRNLAALDLPLQGLQLEIFDELKNWRKSKADELDVPAFVIFSDKTLRQIVHSKAHSLSELRAVNGLGDIKLERFGAEVLGIVSKY